MEGMGMHIYWAMGKARDLFGYNAKVGQDVYVGGDGRLAFRYWVALWGENGGQTRWEDESWELALKRADDDFRSVFGRTGSLPESASANEINAALMRMNDPVRQEIA